MTRSVTGVLNDVDTMLGGSDTGSMLTRALSDKPCAPVVGPPPEPEALFSTYLVSPSYYAETNSELLVKMSSSKGEPFYLLDTSKTIKPLVCATTQIFLGPYNADSACSDECDGLPGLHVVPDAVAQALMSHAFKCVPTGRYFAGLVFVSSVGIQFYYRSSVLPTVGDPEIISIVYRVATNAEGQIEARDVRGAVTCDYPVPYLLIDQEVFSEGVQTCAIVDSLTQANVALIDSLCRLQYVPLHAAESQPDTLDATLGEFMGKHSNLVRALLEAQLRSDQCDDAFVRRQRKVEIDTLVRLMMREVELIAQLKRVIEELVYVQAAVQECPAAPVIPALEEKPVARTTSVVLAERRMEDLQLPPLSTPVCQPVREALTLSALKMPRDEIERRSRMALGEASDVSSIDDMLSTPVSSCDPGMANADLLGSPSSSDSDVD